MAASSSQADQNDGGPTWQPQEAKHRQRHLHRNLNVEVPVVASTGCFAGCFRPSPTSSSRCASPSGVNPPHADRPASPSPSLIKSPSAWIRARGQSFASSARHGRRRSGDFHYDARSYARNFDEGTDGEASSDEAGLADSDAFKHRWFSSRLPPSPTPPSALSPACDAGGGAKASEPAREKGRGLD